MLKDSMEIAGELGIAHANPAQLEAILFDGPGPLLVLAGPGSGKTFVITHRIRYLTEIKGIAPEKLLVLTFTRDAAASMKERYLHQSSVKQFNVSQSVKQNNVSRAVNFGTFHSIFYHVLKQSLSFQDRQLLTDMDKKNILLPVLRKLLPDLYEIQRNNLAIESMSTISYYKNSGNKAEAMRRIPLELRGRFDELYYAYEKERRSLGKVDYDDMLIDCRRLLEEQPEVRTYWQNRFDAILIDEFQDMNPAQYEVIRLLSKEPYPIFAVGDDDQSIYGFRGADPSCMQTFAQEYHAKQITLNVNYRSRQSIVDASLKVIGQNKNRFPKDLKSYEMENNVTVQVGKVEKEEKKEKKEGNVLVKGFLTKDAEQEYLVKQCHDFLKNADKHMNMDNYEQRVNQGKDMAVLFRTNRLMQRMALRLRQEGISFVMREKQLDPYQNETILDLFAYLKLASGEGDVNEVIRIVNKPSRYVSREALSACRGETKEENKSQGDGNAFLDKLISYFRIKNPRAMERLKQLKTQLKTLRNLSPYTAVQYVRRMIGYDRWVQEQYEEIPEKKEECMELLDWLSKEAKKYDTMMDFLECKNTFKDNSARADMNQNREFIENRIDSKITLMTVHAAKGLEFDCIVMPHCNERIYPHGSMLDEAVLEEERRVFYVGMTRAKSRLELTYVKGTREHPEDVSRFLVPFIK